MTCLMIWMMPRGKTDALPAAAVCTLLLQRRRPAGPHREVKERESRGAAGSGLVAIKDGGGTNCSHRE